MPAISSVSLSDGRRTSNLRFLDRLRQHGSRGSQRYKVKIAAYKASKSPTDSKRAEYGTFLFTWLPICLYGGFDDDFAAAVDFRGLRSHRIGHPLSYAPLPAARKRQIQRDKDGNAGHYVLKRKGLQRRNGAYLEEQCQAYKISHCRQTVKRFDMKIADKLSCIGPSRTCTAWEGLLHRAGTT